MPKLIWMKPRPSETIESFTIITRGRQTRRFRRFTTRMPVIIAANHFALVVEDDHPRSEIAQAGAGKIRWMTR